VLEHQHSSRNTASRVSRLPVLGFLLSLLQFGSLRPVWSFPLYHLSYGMYEIRSD
jgi:hypothetical protein